MLRLLLVCVVALALGAASAAEEARALLKAGKFEEAITLLEKAPAKDPAVAKARVEAHLAYGDHFMFHKEMRPMQKYPAALREYRKVLALDKDNVKARESIATIEGIYKSMGRPVPQ
jgi:tetratricopeptide (TPR) repeat protein